MTSDRPDIGAVRRATVADAVAVAALAPGLVPSTADDHATFVVDGAAGPIAVIDLLQAPDHLGVERLVAPDLDVARYLARFAEAIARDIGLGEIRVKPGAMIDDLAPRLGFANGAKAVGKGRLTRAGDYLESVGVPLWRDGWAPLSQSLYFRGVWAAIALLFGFGSISAAVFAGGELRWFHIVLPATLCVVGILFAVWQIFLMIKAARRGGRRLVFALASGLAALTVFLIASLVFERAVPALSELWSIYTGEYEGDLNVTVSRDGRRLYVDGPYGVRSAEAVRQALQQNEGIREVVLSGPGGFVSTGMELFRMFRERKLATRVESRCASACTIAFLGGVERTVSPIAKLGFHRAGFPGLSDSDMYDANRGIRQFLIYGARLTPEFAQRVLDTPTDTIWVPTPEELLAGKVINRVNP